VTLANRTIARSILLFLVFYGLMMAPWPGVRQVYRAGYISVGRFVFQTLAPRTVQFEAVDNASGEDPDTIVLVRHRQEAGWVRWGLNTRQAAYLPSVVLVSLILATPAGRSRRGVNLLWGLLLVHAFIAVRLVIVVLSARSWPLEADAAADVSFWTEAFQTAVKCFVAGQGLGYIVPIVIWAVVAGRHAHADSILSRNGQCLGPRKSTVVGGPRSKKIGMKK